MGLKTNGCYGCNGHGQYIYGKGYMTRGNKYPVQGKGFIDAPIKMIKSLIDTIGGVSNIGKAATDIGNIAKNTKNIFKSTPPPAIKNTNIDDIVKIIKGTGFHITK